MSLFDRSRMAATVRSAALLFALVTGLSGSAHAADPEPVGPASDPADPSVVATDEQVARVYGSMPAEDPGRYPPLDVPTRPWAYDDRYLFQLTRGLEEHELSTGEQVACMVGTVPVDVVTLPAAAIAGLFGS